MSLPPSWHCDGGPTQGDPLVRKREIFPNCFTPTHSPRRSMMDVETYDAPQQTINSSAAADSEQARENLARFEKLDFGAWNKRDWDLFRKLHADKVKVGGFGQQTE